MKHLLFMIGCFAGILFSVSESWGQNKSLVPWDDVIRKGEITHCMELLPQDSVEANLSYCNCYVQKLEKKYPNLNDLEMAMRKDRIEAKRINDKDRAECEIHYGKSVNVRQQKAYKIHLQKTYLGIIKTNANIGMWDSTDQKILAYCLADKIMQKYPVREKYDKIIYKNDDSTFIGIMTMTMDCQSQYSLPQKPVQKMTNTPTQKKMVWTEAYKNLYVKPCALGLKNEMKELGENAILFHPEPYCRCLINKLQPIYPTPDSMLVVATAIGDEFYEVLHGDICNDCAEANKKPYVLSKEDSLNWSPTTEKQYYDELLADLDNEETRKSLNVEGYCKCALVVSKKYYPRRMDMYLADNIPNEALSKKYDAALDSCATKYRKEVREKDQDINTGFRPWTLRDQERFVSGYIKKTDAGNKKSARKMNAEQYCTCLADKLIEQMPNYAKVEKMINNNTLEQYMNRQLSEENDQCARQALIK